MLFHEVYGNYYNAVAAILSEAAAGGMTGRRLADLVREKAFDESALTIPGRLTGAWRLMRRDLSTPLENHPSMPLTTLQKRWLKALMLDPRIALFHPDPSGLEDVEPRFTPDMFVYYDRNGDGDPYDDGAYRERFGIILAALREGKTLRVGFTSPRGMEHRLVITPRYLEYSAKDDRFRLIAHDARQNWTVNLARVTDCALSEAAPAPEPPPAPRATLTLELVDERRALERALLHFSHLEKETVRLDDTRYRITLQYHHEDETELLIRVLSFGPMVKVVAPDSFAALLRERLEAQTRLMQSGRAE